MKRIWILLVLLGVLFLAACAQTSQDTTDQGSVVNTEKGQYTDISVDQLNQMLENKDFVFINVHIPFEGNIPQTDRSIPYNEIEQHLDELPQDIDAKIVLYCRSDHMSNIAARTLADLGYTHLYNLDGGFAAWEGAGLPIERTP